MYICIYVCVYIYIYILLTASATFGTGLACTWPNGYLVFFSPAFLGAV